jgi:hypothetical protein
MQEGFSMEHEILTGRIIKAAIAVHRALGPGFIESIYEAALCIELEDEVCLSGTGIDVISFNSSLDTELVESSFSIKLAFGRMLNGCIKDDDFPINVRVGGCKVEFYVGQELSNGVTIEVPSCEGWRGSHW